MSSTPIKLRCAIYTRKSTEEGLEQEFNSLDAQREACSAFITSQIGLGWKQVPGHYDDGGISGGTMERPALQRLLQDIRDHKVDVVVVYKIDRLTRSLMDFSRIVEIFDASGVSFVSVTQQFNTTTSMGRLTLNVLLSFAQFEREVTAERIRDKVTASRKKGMWMGGTVPLGYQVSNKKLVINEYGGAEVQRIFNRYLQLQSVPALASEMRIAFGGQGDDDNIMSKRYGHQIGEASISGEATPLIAHKSLGLGKLYYMLANPIYVGKVRHDGELYAGEHQPIIAQDVFDRAQELLAAQAPRPRGTTVLKNNHLLNGILFDDTGDRMSPIHVSKADSRYRYYISAKLKNGNSDQSRGWRLRADEIEAVVIYQIRRLLSDKATLARWIGEHISQQDVQLGLTKAALAASKIDLPSVSFHRVIVRSFFRRITLASDVISFDVQPAEIARLLTSADEDDDSTVRKISRSASKGTPAKRRRTRSASAAHHCEVALDHGPIQTITWPMTMKRRGIETRLVIDGPGQPSRKLDQPLVNAIARAHAYLEALIDGAGRDRLEVAALFGVHPQEVSRTLPLAFLGPELTESILNGTQDASLSVRDLVRGIDLPLVWRHQIELLAA